MKADWAQYHNFTEAEFRCKHTGKCEMDHGFMVRLQRLRLLYGKPMVISSGYRDRTHPIEAKKAAAGAHTTGHAADIAVRGHEALDIIRLALAMGFTGVGVQQKGEGRFIHLDDCTTADGFPRPTIWSY